MSPHHSPFSFFGQPVFIAAYSSIPKWMTVIEKPCLAIRIAKWMAGAIKILLLAGNNTMSALNFVSLPLQSKPSKFHLPTGQQEVLIIPWANTINFELLLVIWFFFTGCIVSIRQTQVRESHVTEYFTINCSRFLWKFYSCFCDQ